MIIKPKNRIELLNILPKNGIVAEIGVKSGLFAKHIYEISQPKKIFLIDCWESQKGSYEIDSTNNQNHEKCYKDVLNHFGKYKNAIIIKDYSQNACKCFENNFFDWVYIDANHTYDAIFNDINNWWPLIKNNGYICGHDYFTDYWVDVELAVNNFLKLNKKNLYALTLSKYPSWCIKKNEIKLI